MANHKKYRPEMCAAMLEMGAKGYGRMEMVAALKITHRTFLNWLDSNPEFAEAAQEAAYLSQAWWERRGREATFGGVDGFNATSYIFQMKNRFRKDWRERAEVLHEFNLGEELDKLDGGDEQAG